MQSPRATTTDSATVTASTTTPDAALDGLRAKIDEIDNKLHDLLMERAEVAAAIGGAKQAAGAGGGPFIRPGREALVMRRLAERHRGTLPSASIMRIWREIFAAGTAAQGSFSVAVAASGPREGLSQVARDHFGSLTPLVALRSPAQVLEAVAEGKVSLGVLPLPQSEEIDPWWRRMARQGQPGVPRIVARLPFIASPESSEDEALAVALTEPGETGDDRVILGVEASAEVSRSGLQRLMTAAGFTPLDMWAAQPGGGEALYLIECDGPYREEDPRFAKLLASEDGSVHNIWSLGGYATPLSL